MKNTNEQIKILMSTARSYMILAKCLESKGIENKHYILAGMDCCKKVIEINKIKQNATQKIDLAA